MVKDAKKLVNTVFESWDYEGLFDNIFWMFGQISGKGCQLRKKIDDADFEQPESEVAAAQSGCVRRRPCVRARARVAGVYVCCGRRHHASVRAAAARVPVRACVLRMACLRARGGWHVACGWPGAPQACRHTESLATVST